jgi:hypothetical protein
MRNLILFSIAIASAFVIEGCTSPNEENEQKTVTYNILERNSYDVKYNTIVVYDTIQLYPDVLINQWWPTGALSSYNFVDYKLTNVYDEELGGFYVDWGIRETIVDTTWCWYPYKEKINSEETFTITDNNQIIRTVKATNVATTFNIRNRITDTARIADRLNSCSKIKFICYPSLQPLYYNTDKPSVLYEIEGRYDDELMFVCNDEVHRSNKVFVYYFYKTENHEHLESYTLVPAPIDNE